MKRLLGVKMPQPTLEQLHKHRRLIVFAFYGGIAGCTVVGGWIGYRLSRPK